MHDVVVIGGGPAGLSTGLVARGNGLDVCVLESAEVLGGQLRRADHPVVDVLGQPARDGLELVERLQQHVAEAGVLVLFGFRVARVVARGGSFVLHAEDGRTVEALHVVLATGTRARRLGFPGEDRPARRADAAWVGRRVVIIGGGDEATSTAVELARQDVDVTMVVRGALRARPAFEAALRAEPRIEVREGETVARVDGASVHLASGAVVEAVQVLVRAGVEVVVPAIEPAPARDRGGCVVVDVHHQTTVPGLYAIGDCTVDGPLRYVAIAIAHGVAVARRIEGALPISAADPVYTSRE